MAGRRRGARRAARPADRGPRRRRRRRPARRPRARSPARRAARRASRSPRSSAPGAWSRASGAWQVDVEPLRGGTHRGRPRAARLHRQRDRRAARRAARRSIRSAASPTCARGRLRMAAPRRVRRGPAARAAARAPRASSSTSTPTPRPLRERRRARASGCAASSAERVFAELRRIVAAREARRGLELMGALGATAVVLPELEALRGVRAEPLPPPRRLRPHARGARPRRSS